MLAVVINTIAGACIIACQRGDAVLYFLFGGIFSLVFSFPGFVVVWITLYILLKKRYCCNEVISALLVVGVVIAALIYGVFFLVFPLGKEDILFLCLATTSGCTGVGLSYKNIWRHCLQRDGQELTIDQTGQKEHTPH